MPQSQKQIAERRVRKQSVESQAMKRGLRPLISTECIVVVGKDSRGKVEVWVEETGLWYTLEVGSD